MAEVDSLEADMANLMEEDMDRGHQLVPVMPDVSTPRGASSSGDAASKSPEHKRPRVDPGSSASSLDFRVLGRKGFGVNVQADIKQDECDMRATLNKVNTKLDATLQQWETLTPTTGFRDAMLVLAMYMEFNIVWDTRSDILLARVVAAIGGERLVAHSDAPRFYSNGWWERIDVLPAALVLAIEDAFNRARYLCKYLGAEGVERKWDVVFDKLEFFDGWEDYMPVEKFDLKKDHWTTTAAYVFEHIPWRASAVNNNNAMAGFATFFCEDVPPVTEL